MMEHASAGLSERIAARVRGLRAARGLSLEGLAGRSGVSRSMISVIERGESSPTAVVLERLAAGLGVPLASLFEAGAAVEGEAPGFPDRVARREEQPAWRDPGSGYVRRNVSPSGVAQPMRIVEVEFPAGGRVVFESVGTEVRVHQQVWVLEGTIEIQVGSERHCLSPGDCLAMTLDDRPTLFHNPTREPARYAVVSVSEPVAQA